MQNFFSNKKSIKFITLIFVLITTVYAMNLYSTSKISASINNVVEGIVIV